MNAVKRVGYGLFLVAFTLLVAELLLRTTDPFGIRIRGDRITLDAKVVHTFRNEQLPDVDSLVHLGRNAIGFRGPDPPADLSTRLSIVAVGGSTTECMYLSDGQDWPSLLAKLLAADMPQVWVNNAGLDGHSTFGHRILLEDHILPLKPDVVLLLVGANELGRRDIGRFDRYQLRDRSIRGIFGEMELVHSFQAWRMARAAKEQGVGHGSISLNVDAPRREIPHEQLVLELDAERPLVEAYKERLTGLVKLIQANGSLPVLMTQPSLFTAAFDPVTGVDLSRYPWQEHSNGAALAAKLAMYNESTLQVGRELQLPVIDLAATMKVSSREFYDAFHFTRTGSRVVSALVAEGLRPYLADLLD
ncbi:MAG: SGNH/GDSL hydrolase family protein [Flavobacteriales bacterium]|nr:SGNH/GDSL hydrolase family protein [Flavobacteriales bacterium]